MSDFTFDFTEGKLASCIPANKNVSALFDVLNELLPKYDITTPERVAAFLAQCGHEATDFTVLRENLNYRAAGLMQLFKSYFPTSDLATAYEHQPEKIANRIYANRMGNGDEASGDGWKYHGRGAIQITGEYMYNLLATNLDQTIEDTVTYCETLEGAVESACWFWTKHGLNGLADMLDTLTITKRINGGTNGLADRQARYDHNMQVLP